MVEIAELVGHDPGRGARHGDLLRHAPPRAGRQVRRRASARTSPACWPAATSCSSTPRATLGDQRRGDDGRRRSSPSRRPSASPTATSRPCVQVNHRYVRTTTPEAFDGLLDELRAGGRATRSRAHGTLIRDASAASACVADRGRGRRASAQRPPRGARREPRRTAKS